MSGEQPRTETRICVCHDATHLIYVHEAEATAAMPLDVERLARAYENSRQVDFWPDGRWAWVADEYARLSADEEGGTP